MSAGPSKSYQMVQQKNGIVRDVNIEISVIRVRRPMVRRMMHKDPSNRQSPYKSIGYQAWCNKRAYFRRKTVEELRGIIDHLKDVVRLIRRLIKEKEAK